MQETRRDLVWIKRISLMAAIGLLSYFLIMTIIIPVARSEIETPAENPGDYKFFRPDLNWQLTVEDSLKERAIELKAAEAFLLARLEMTDSDSISMAISLIDSSIALVMQGVTIYTGKIQSYKISNAFTEADPFVLAHWLSRPFVVDTHYASIPKVPVLYKKAPKDTIEAMSQMELDPLKDDLDPVHFSLKLDRNLILDFHQAEIPEKEFAHKLKAFKKQMRRIERRNTISHLLNFTPVEFVPGIQIVLDKKAARVIYRAIPQSSLVALQLPVK